MQDLSAIILTLNEERHIERCIDSLRPFAREIFVVDSGSTDRTVQIAQACGAQVARNPWLNYAAQFNWALEHLPLRTAWVMRMDADEYATPELAGEIDARLHTLPAETAGVYVARRVHFMGRWIRHGGYYPTYLLRLWRRGRGRCEERWMDEHIQLLDGSAEYFRGDIVDDNRNDLTWWISKHNAYATREAVDLLNVRYGFAHASAPRGAHQDTRKRWVKERIYARLPAGLRAWCYFLYRYILRGGFLDGYQGAVFHVLQGFWYRFLVDAKIYEVERKMSLEGLDAKTVLARDYGIRFD